MPCFRLRPWRRGKCAFTVSPLSATLRRGWKTPLSRSAARLALAACPLSNTWINGASPRLSAAVSTLPLSMAGGCNEAVRIAGLAPLHPARAPTGDDENRLREGRVAHSRERRANLRCDFL